MKILIDEVELNEAFELISDLRNHINPDNPLWFKLQLQKACNILGPMWANGVNENKILVDIELFKDLLHELDYNQECGVINVKSVIKKILENNPEQPTFSNNVLVNPVEIDGFKKLTDIVSDMADIINAYLWNTHTKESERSARLLDDTIKGLEELRNENIS